MADSESSNYALFRDCLSTTLLRPAVTESGQKRRRRAKRRTSEPEPEPSPEPEPEPDAEDLADFIDYLADGLFQSLPEELQTLDYRSWRDSDELRAQFSLPLTLNSLSTLDLPSSITETLTAYKLIPCNDASPSPTSFLLPILSSYLDTLTCPPPSTQRTRTDACEICQRSWIPLSYHHLIPRFVHDKAVKRGWHRKEDLQNVAWLCGACHRFVHRFRNHEELAREYYTVELLLAEEEVRQFAEWAGRLRWKGGKTRARS